MGLPLSTSAHSVVLFEQCGRITAFWSRFGLPYTRDCLASLKCTWVSSASRKIMMLKFEGVVHKYIRRALPKVVIMIATLARGSTLQ